MMYAKARIAACLAALLAAGSVISCGNTKSSDTETSAPSQAGTETAAAETETEAPDPFEGFDYGGAEIRMLVSAIDYDGQGSSNYTIKHDEKTGGDVVRDAVYERNRMTEDLLNVKFVFTDNEKEHNQISAELKKIISAGDDAYDLIIHDLYPMASLSVEGYFLNVFDGKYFDFSQDYWYDPYMKDVSFDSPDKRFLLAGDYFLDILRSAHALYFNKEMFASLYQTPDVLYQHVLDGTWTHETFLTYASEGYRDLNGDGTHDLEDQHGFGYVGTWGSMIPWVIAADTTFLSYQEDGAPYFDMNNEHSVALLESLNEIFYAPSAFNHSQLVKEDVLLNTESFMSGKILFGGYQRVSSLEVFRNMDLEIGILPYPKFDEQQDHYITSTHDTTNIGVIPITCPNLEMVSAVLEVLSRETAKTVMPAYYETALKIKYSRDNQSAQMLDIIRYNIENVFPLAFGNYCSNLALYQAFSTPLTRKSTDFSSNYVKHEKGAQKKLDKLWEAFSSIDG